MNGRSDKAKCEDSVNASGTINKKWLQLIWLLHIRWKTKDVICYQRYNDPSQGLLQSLTFTISIWATHEYNRGIARNTKEDNAEVSSVPPRYTTWSTVKPFAVQRCHRTVTKNADACDFPPTQQPPDKSLARQPGLTVRELDETLGTCRATILQLHSACTRHSVQGLCERGKKLASEGSDYRLLRCPALCLLNPTQQKSPHSSTWRRKEIQVPKRCVIFWIREDRQSPETCQV